MIDRDSPHTVPGDAPYSTIVYAARGSDVRTTIVDGELLVDEFRHCRMDAAAVVHEARHAAADLMARVAHFRA